MVKGPVERNRAPCSLLGASTGTLSAGGWLVDRELNRYGNPPREAPPASGAVVSNLSDTVEEMPSGEHGGRRQELSLGPTTKLDIWIQSHWDQAPGDCGERCGGVRDMGKPRGPLNPLMALGEFQPFITGDGGSYCTGSGDGTQAPGQLQGHSIPHGHSVCGGSWSCISSEKVGPTLPCPGLATESLSLFVSKPSGFGVLVCCWRVKGLFSV